MGVFLVIFISKIDESVAKLTFVTLLLYILFEKSFFKVK